MFVESTGLVDETVERSACLCSSDVVNQVDTKGGAKFGGTVDTKHCELSRSYSFGHVTYIDLFNRHLGSFSALVRTSVFQPIDIGWTSAL